LKEEEEERERTSFNRRLRAY